MLNKKTLMIQLLQNKLKNSTGTISLGKEEVSDILSSLTEVLTLPYKRFVSSGGSQHTIYLEEELRKCLSDNGISIPLPHVIYLSTSYGQVKGYQASEINYELKKNGYKFFEVN